MSEEQQTFYYLSVALAIGLLIGVERGWQEREAEEGGRVAGIRTYGLIGLLGGAVALLSRHIGSLVPRLLGAETSCLSRCDRYGCVSFAQGLHSRVTKKPARERTGALWSDVGWA